MRQLRSPKIWIPLIVVVFLIGIPLLYVFVIRPLQASLDPICGKHEDANEVIDSLDAGARLIKLYDPTKNVNIPGLGRVDLIVRVEASTRIWRQQGPRCQDVQAVSFSDLRAGQKIKVWSRSGILITTYPGQLTDASDIVIVA